MGTGSHGSGRRGPGAQLSCSLASSSCCSSCGAVPLSQRSLARCAVTQLHTAVETKHSDWDFSLKNRSSAPSFTSLDLIRAANLAAPCRLARAVGVRECRAELCRLCLCVNVAHSAAKSKAAFSLHNWLLKAPVGRVAGGCPGVPQPVWGKKRSRLGELGSGSRRL